jgi:hypothetical protein
VRAAAGDSPPNRSPPIVLPALFAVRPLDELTWPDFARLVERHNGVWGGCWCMGFHAEGVGRHKTAAVSSSFLHNGTVSLFEGHGFERTRRLGKHRWVVSKVAA